MAAMWRRAMVYLGLQDDEEAYEDYYDDEGLEPEPRDEPPAREPREVRAAPRRVVEPTGSGSVRALPADEPSGVGAVRPGSVRAVATTTARVHVVDPEGFNDAQEVGDRLKASQPVILNLQGLPRDLQRRLIDFSSGLTYAVGGSMSRVADQVFLLTPSDVEVSQEEKERLKARGLYHG